MWRRNDLDPMAFDAEPSPFIITGLATDRQAHLGVHTATEYELAAVYAVQRAMVDGTFAVVLTLDVDGLTPLPDRDAMLLARTRGLDGIPGLVEATEASDIDQIEEILEEAQEHAEPGCDASTPITWLESAYQSIQEQQNQGVISTLLELSDTDLLAAMQTLTMRGVFPSSVLLQIVGQQRYMTKIGIERLIQVDLLRPVRVELWTGEEREETGDDWPPDDKEQPQVFTDEDFFEDNWMPDRVTIWKRSTAHEGVRVEYHGTDAARALAAFPELEEQLRTSSPWPCTQPIPDFEPSIFAVPQDIIERISAASVGVGIFPVALSTGRYLIGERSWAVQDPGQWAGFGGSVLPGGRLAEGALRELAEETGYQGYGDDLEEFRPGLFILYVQEEFAPRLNWETEQARWMTLDEVAELESRHWGTDALLRHVLD